MPSQMTIEQAAEYLREKLPVGTEYHVSICALGVAGKDSAKPMGAKGKVFGAPSDLSGAVRAAVDRAKGQEAGNV